MQPKCEIVNIECCQNDLELRYNKHHLTATNPVKILSPEGYFRECRNHIPLNDYIANTTKEFFDEIIPVCYGEWGGYKAEYRSIIELLSNKSNFDKFVSMGSSSNTNSPLMRFHREKDYDAIGLRGFENKMPWNIINTFVWYSRSHIDAYMSAKGVAKNGYQTYNASRGIATYQMAKVLQVEEMIPATFYANLKVKDGRDRFGSFMLMARGIHYDEYSKYSKDKVITPQLQRYLTMLNLLDAITYEKDHRLNNYNIVFNENGDAEAVCAYDNDSGPCFFLSPSPVFTTYAGCSPIIKGSIINRPHLDQGMAERLLEIKRKDINKALDGYCNKLQIWACWNRIQKLQKVIISSVKSNPKLLLNVNQWSQETIDEELSGKYGKTYLGLLNGIYK